MDVKEMLSDPGAMQALHREFAARCSNLCWEEIDKPQRRDEDNERMVMLAYASLWHWTQREDCAPLNLAMAYWQLARAHVLAELPEPAMLFARKTLAIAEEEHLDPLYLGYAHEAVTRAAIALGERETAEAALAQAAQCLRAIEEKQLRDDFWKELDPLRQALGLATI